MRIRVRIDSIAVKVRRLSPAMESFNRVVLVLLDRGNYRFLLRVPRDVPG